MLPLILAVGFGLALGSCSRESEDNDDSENTASDAPVTFQGNLGEGNSFNNAPNKTMAEMPTAGSAFNLESEAREFSELSDEQKAALQSLIEEFRKDPNRRAEILEEIESNYYGAEILSLVREIMGMGDESTTVQALEMLGGNTSPDIIPVLDQALGNSSEDVRLAAVYAASQVRDESFVEFIGKSFEDKSESVRLTGLDLLENQTKQNRFKVYDKAMTSSQSDVNMAAVMSLEIESNIDSIDILIKGMESPDPDVRLEAATSLEFQLDQNFESAKQAKDWWTKNRNRYDEDLFPKDS